MKPNVILIIAVLLTGCGSPYMSILPATTQVDIVIRQDPDITKINGNNVPWDERHIVLKPVKYSYNCQTNKTEDGYQIKYHYGMPDCKPEPGYVPNEFTIEYLRWRTTGDLASKGWEPQNINAPTATYRPSAVPGERNMEAVRYNNNLIKIWDKDVDTFAAKDWLKITLHPAADLKELKKKGPDPVGKGHFIAGTDKEIFYLITLNPDNTVKSIEKSYGWAHIGNFDWRDQ